MHNKSNVNQTLKIIHNKCWVDRNRSLSALLSNMDGALNLCDSERDKKYIYIFFFFFFFFFYKRLITADVAVR